MVYVQTRFHPTEFLTHKILWDFALSTDHLILVRRPGQVSIEQEKITCHQVDFSVLVKIKESKKISKYLDLAREMKKL